MPFFTPVKTLPEGTVYFTDLTPVRDFADWLAEFDVLLDKHQDSLFALHRHAADRARPAAA